jgi:hypothetical protein
MAAQPLHQAQQAPRRARNLAAPLAGWLRTQGFTAYEQLLPVYAAVAAHWIGPAGEYFLLEYEWVAGPVPAATCRLRVLYASQAQFEPLFASQKVHRLKEVRLLLLNCVRYANARLMARPTTTCSVP